MKGKDEKYKVDLKTRISIYKTLYPKSWFKYYNSSSYIKKSDFKENLYAVENILSKNYFYFKIIQEDLLRKDFKLNWKGKDRKEVL